jgi:hypothetical protein
MSSKKKLGIILVILGILGGIVGIGMLNTRAQTPPRTVVERFYGNWIDVVRAGDNPVEQGIHTKSVYVTEDFGRAVARTHEQGRDGVMCIDHAPTTFTVQEAKINSAKNRAGVDFVADGVEGHVVLITDEKGWWRISEVDCPKVTPSVTATSTSATSAATSTTLE